MSPSSHHLEAQTIKALEELGKIKESVYAKRLS